MKYSATELEISKETMIIGSSVVYANTAAFPTSNIAEGTRVFAQDTNRPYIYQNNGYYLIGDSSSYSIG